MIHYRNGVHVSSVALRVLLGGFLGLGGMHQAAAIDLLESYRLALQNDATYSASKNDNLAAQELVSQARAQLMPNISANGYRAKAITQASNGLYKQGYQYFSSNYALKLSQPIYRKYNFALYSQAKAQVRASDASLDSDRETLVDKLSTAYFNALLANEQLALVLSQKSAYAEQLKAAKQSFSAGFGTRTDIDDARAKYDMTVAQELQARQNLTFTRRELGVLIDRPQVDDLARLDPKRLVLAMPDERSENDWVARGETHNPELQALLAKVDAARLEVEKARAGHYPTIDLFAQRSESASDTNTSINSRYLTSQVGVQFNLPLFAGGYVNSQVRQALANQDKFKDQYEARRREIGQNIRKQYESVSQGILKVQALEQAERSSAQAVYSSKKGFEAGTRTRLDILNAEQQHTNTLRDLAQARYEYLVARIRLRSIADGEGEQAIQTVNAWFI